jgi:hypothetical protein
MLSSCLSAYDTYYDVQVCVSRAFCIDRWKPIRHASPSLKNTDFAMGLISVLYSYAVGYFKNSSCCLNNILCERATTFRP